MYNVVYSSRAHRMLTEPPTFCHGSKSASAGAAALRCTARATRGTAAVPLLTPAYLYRSQMTRAHDGALTAGRAAEAEGEGALACTVRGSTPRMSARRTTAGAGTEAIMLNMFHLHQSCFDAGGVPDRTSEAMRECAGVHCRTVAPSPEPSQLHLGSTAPSEYQELCMLPAYTNSC